MKTTRMFILMVALTMIGLPAYAQTRTQGQPPDDRQQDEGAFAPDPGQGSPPSDERREEVRKKIEAIRIWRLTEELKLDTNTSAKLSSVLSSFEQQRRDIMREQMTTMREMRLSLRSAKPDESKLKAALEKLEKNHRSMQELREKEFRSLKDILTIEQQARYLLFQQAFQREMQGMIAGARGGGKGMGSGPGLGNGQMRGGGGPPDTR